MKKGFKIFSSIFILLMVVAVAISIKENFYAFMSINISQLATLVIAIFLSFYFTQAKLDKRKLQDAVGDICQKLSVALNNDILFDFDADNFNKKIGILQQQIENYIDIISCYGAEFLDKEDIVYIKNQIESYWNFVGDHRDDADFLKKSEISLRKNISSAITKTNQLCVQIYAKY